MSLPCQMARQTYRAGRVAVIATSIAACILAAPVYAQDSNDPSRLSGKELNEAWANRATTADEAIANLVRGYLAEHNVGTPTTTIRFIPYKSVSIDEECQTILKGKDYRLTADELPSRVTLQWGKSPEDGLTVSTNLRFEVNDRRQEDNALKYFSYPTLVAVPLADGSYHAQVLIPTGPTMSQLAAVGKLYETGEAVRLGPGNSDYDSRKGSVWAVKLDDDVQRVMRDYFLPLESFVSHPKHAPRQQKTRFKIGYFKSLDVAFVVQSRVYDVFLIRGGQIRLSRSEPWTYIHNAKTYNSPSYQKRLANLCVSVFPKAQRKAPVAASEAAKRTTPGFARNLATEIVSPPRPGPAVADASVLPVAESSMPRPLDYWLEEHPGWIDRLNGGTDTDLLKSDYSDVGN